METCDGNVLYQGDVITNPENSGLNANLEGCKNKCSENIECMFFVLSGKKQNYCRLYNSCKDFQSINTNGITFARQTSGRQALVDFAWG